MRLIAVRDEIQAWANEPFDPVTDDVTLRTAGRQDVVVRWQSALKFGYWEEPSVQASAEEFYNKNHSPQDGRFTSGGGGANSTFKVITAAQARGDSRPVSHDEFQRLATIGRTQLEGYARNAKKINLSEEQWSQVKSGAYAEVRKSWGGATINLHTGEPLPQGVNAWAITVKSTKGKRTQNSISVHENATEAEFNAAMDHARQRFGYTLARESHYLGVFHDDANHRIDIDPVLVVHRHADVETIGAATHAIGGAYNFRDGLGYWPPHIDTSSTATNKRDDYVRTYDGG